MTKELEEFPSLMKKELFVHIEESFDSPSTLEAFDIRKRIIGTLKLDFPFQKNNKSRISAKLLCKIAIAYGAAVCKILKLLHKD